jgi:hypothetical protein
MIGQGYVFMIMFEVVGAGVAIKCVTCGWALTMFDAKGWIFIEGSAKP